MELHKNQKVPGWGSVWRGVGQQDQRGSPERGCLGWREPWSVRCRKALVMPWKLLRQGQPPQQQVPTAAGAGRQVAPPRGGS